MDVLPGGTDENHLYITVNKMTLQLEQSDIIKAMIMESFCSSSETNNRTGEVRFNELWQALRDINTHLVRGISFDQRTLLFGMYLAHLTEQEFPFRGTTLICSECPARPILWNNSSFQGIGIENRSSLPIAFLINFIRWRKACSSVKRPPNHGTSNIKKAPFLPLCKSFKSCCCYKRDQPSDFGLWFLLLIEIKE